jgi:hypothetical protein
LELQKKKNKEKFEKIKEEEITKLKFKKKLLNKDKKMSLLLLNQTKKIEMKLTN